MFAIVYTSDCILSVKINNLYLITLHCEKSLSVEIKH